MEEEDEEDEIREREKEELIFAGFLARNEKKRPLHWNRDWKRRSTSIGGEGCAIGNMKFCNLACVT